MDAEEFVDVVRKVVMHAADDGVISSLTEPPGFAPPVGFGQKYHFYLWPQVGVRPIPSAVRQRRHKRRRTGTRKTRRLQLILSLGG